MSERNTQTIHKYLLQLAERISGAEEEYQAECDAIRSMLTNGYPVKAMHVSFSAGKPLAVLTEKDKAIIKAYAAGEDILVMLLSQP